DRPGPASMLAKSGPPTSVRAKRAPAADLAALLVDSSGAAVAPAGNGPPALLPDGRVNDPATADDSALGLRTGIRDEEGEDGAETRAERGSRRSRGPPPSE